MYGKIELFSIDQMTLGRNHISSPIQKLITCLMLFEHSAVKNDAYYDYGNCVSQEMVELQKKRHKNGTHLI